MVKKIVSARFRQFFQSLAVIFGTIQAVIVLVIMTMDTDFFLKYKIGLTLILLTGIVTVIADLWFLIKT